MKSKVLASEIIAEQESRLRDVVMELDCMDIDFDKTSFILGELIDSIDLEEPKTMDDALLLHEKQMRIDMYVGIVADYVRKIQTTISDIVIRERRSKVDRSEDNEHEND